MSVDKLNQNEGPVSCMNLESVNRFSKLPVVESTIQTGKNIYDRVKDSNSLANWTLSTAENTMYKAVEVGKPYAAPVVHTLEGPIKRVDDILCTGLDYIESKLPAVKLPPGEMYNYSKDFVANSPTIQSTCSMVQPALQTARNLVEPAMETAKNTVQGAKSMVEPAIGVAKCMVEPAKNMMEPYVQSSMDKAAAIRDYGTQKYEEYMHPAAQESGDESSENAECRDCDENSGKQHHH